MQAVNGRLVSYDWMIQNWMNTIGEIAEQEWSPLIDSYITHSSPRVKNNSTDLGSWYKSSIGKIYKHIKYCHIWQGCRGPLENY